MPVSIVIITFNEQENIQNALDSVRWCDDVIVLDSFSSDNTEAICRQYTNVRFFTNKFLNLASQRQYVLDSVPMKHDWIFALDADEVMPAEMGTHLIAIAKSHRQGMPVAYDVALRIVMWGKWLRYSSEYPQFWRRFIHRHHCRYVQRGHADTIDTAGPVGRLPVDLIHDDQKGLSDWLGKHNRYTSQEAHYALYELSKIGYSNLLSADRLMRRRAQKRLFRSLVGNSYIRFAYLYFFRLGFLDGWRGYAFCRLRAHQHFIIRLKQFELKRKADKER